MDYKKIGRFIVELRKEKKMTQEELASKLFVSRTTISKWELGANTINIETLVRISEIFNITIEELMNGEKINRTKTTLRKYLLLTISILFISLTAFLLYYFIYNYNSIAVYETHGTSDNFELHNGLIFISKEKFYINIGYIEKIKDDDINSTKLYYEKNDKQIILYEGNDDEPITYTSTYDGDIQFPYDDLKYLLNNLYLEIEFNGKEKDTIKLNTYRTYSNKALFTKNKKTLKQEDVYNFDTNIPKYVKDNFKFNSNDNGYIWERKENGIEIKESYFPDVTTYFVSEIYGDYEEKYIYTYPNDYSYSKTNIHTGNIELEFTYTDDNDIKLCLNGNCDGEKIKYFNEKYLSKVDFN